MDWKGEFPSEAAVRYMRDVVIPALEGSAVGRDRRGLRRKGKRWMDHHDFRGVPPEVLGETQGVINLAVRMADLDQWEAVTHALERVKALW